MANIGIIGNGNVDTALARWLERAGHEVQAVGGDKGGDPRGRLVG